MAEKQTVAVEIDVDITGASPTLNIKADMHGALILIEGFRFLEDRYYTERAFTDEDAVKEEDALSRFFGNMADGLGQKMQALVELGRVLAELDEKERELAE